MFIIGFSNKTSIPLIRIICRNFKHCVIITKNQKGFILHQFVKRNYVARIVVNERGIAQLKNNGWVFIFVHKKIHKLNPRAWTCVNYVKSGIGLKNAFIQTPDKLYEYITKNLT